MSATNRSDVRTQPAQRHDHYETPIWCLEAIWPQLAIPLDLGRDERNRPVVLDPCAGAGRILGFIRAKRDYILRGVEIDETRARDCVARGLDVICDDALTHSTWKFPATPHLVWTNPPYVHAFAFLQRSLSEIPNATTAFLLRLGFLESKERQSFLKKHKPDLFLLPQRPQFLASIKCTNKACGWHDTFNIDAPETWPWRCPAAVQGRPPQECGAKVTVTTSDASAYAWFVWGPGRGGRFEFLEPKDHYLPKASPVVAA